MPLAFSNGAIIETTFTSDGTKAQIISQWTNALVAAGWGGSSGILTSGTTPQGFKIGMKAEDAGATCVRFRINGATINGNQDFFLLPTNGQLYRIWANKYQYAIFRSGLDLTLTRACVFGGVPWIPDFLTTYLNVPDNYFGWIHGAGSTDTDTSRTEQSTLRAACFGQVVSGQNTSGACWIIRGTTQGAVNFVFCIGRFGGNAVSGSGAGITKWDDLTWFLEEPFVNYAISSVPYPAGLLWDACRVEKDFDGETRFLIGDFTWRVITHRTASQYGNGTLLFLSP